MSTTSEPPSASKGEFSTRNSMSDAEKLKKRREARKKRILASGSDRLDRIVGLTTKSKASSCLLGSIEKSKDAPPSPILSETFYSEPKSPQKEIEATKEDVNETEGVSASAQVESSLNSEICQGEVSRHPMIDSGSFSATNNPFIEEMLKTLSKDKDSATPNNGELSQSETPDMNELIRTMFPQFMAQPAANAFKSFLNEIEPAPPQSPTRKSSRSIWSPDGRFGTLPHKLALAVLVLCLLNVHNGSKKGLEWEERNNEDFTLVELPLLGSLKPYHILLSMEIGLQTQRYFFSQSLERSATHGMTGSIEQIYKLFKFYMVSWTSMVDDFCLVVFLLGIWVLFEPLLSLVHS